MDSGDLARRGFVGWPLITSDNVPEAMSQLPFAPGVYVFRTLEMQHAVRGKSDIAYIGKGTRQGGIQARVRDHFYQPAQPTTNTPSGRIDQWINEWGYQVEIGWLVCESREEAERTERELLEEYEVEHHNLPPINRSMPGGPAK